VSHSRIGFEIVSNQISKAMGKIVAWEEEPHG